MNQYTSDAGSFHSHSWWPEACAPQNKNHLKRLHSCSSRPEACTPKNQNSFNIFTAKNKTLTEKRLHCLSQCWRRSREEYTRTSNQLWSTIRLLIWGHNDPYQIYLDRKFLVCTQQWLWKSSGLTKLGFLSWFLSVFGCIWMSTGCLTKITLLALQYHSEVQVALSSCICKHTRLNKVEECTHSHLYCKCKDNPNSNIFKTSHEKVLWNNN